MKIVIKVGSSYHVHQNNSNEFLLCFQSSNKFYLFILRQFKEVSTFFCRRLYISFVSIRGRGKWYFFRVNLQIKKEGVLFHAIWHAETESEEIFPKKPPKKVCTPKQWKYPNLPPKSGLGRNTCTQQGNYIFFMPPNQVNMLVNTFY